MNFFSLKFIRHSEYGISLIDIMLVFALIFLLAGLSTPNIQKFLNAYRLRIAVSDLSSFMHKAKLISARNNTIVTVDFYPEGFLGYKIENVDGKSITAVSFGKCDHPIITFDKCYEGDILYENPMSGEDNRPQILTIRPNGLSGRGFAYITNKKKGPRSSDRPLYAFITSAIGERPQYNLLKINILNFSGILPYALISH